MLEEMRDTSHSFAGTPLGDRLQTAIDGDLNELSSTQCVGLGYDRTIAPDGKSGEDPSLNCIYFAPQLGFDASNGDKSYLERMTSLFLKKSQDIVHNSYSIIYGSSKYSLFSQAKLMRYLYKILPRRYKKNLSRIYFLNPTSRFRTCVKVCKLFFEDKVADKITFLSSISQLQSILSPLAMKLPPALIQMEDARLTKNLPAMAPLEELYDEYEGAPPFIAKCLAFLRKHAMLREGLFRVPGDQILLNLAPPRFRDKDCSRIILVDDEKDMNMLSCEDRSLSTVNEEENSGEDSPCRQSAAVIVDDVDVVAQLFKSYLRELPDSVITQEAFTGVVKAIRQYKVEEQIAATNENSSSENIVNGKDQEELLIGNIVEQVLEEQLPRSHWNTLQLILEFLADIAEQSPVNKMSPDNISVVFAPTLIRIDMSSPTVALESVPLCQKIVRLLLMRKMESNMAQRLKKKISFSRLRNNSDA